MKECLQAPKLNQYAQHKNEHNVAVLGPIVCKVFQICTYDVKLITAFMLVGLLELCVYLIMESDDPDRQYLKTLLKND
jgi:hypothetical protein